MINRDFSQSVNGMQTICATISTWMFSTATLHVPDSVTLFYFVHTHPLLLYYYFYYYIYSTINCSNDQINFNFDKLHSKLSSTNDITTKLLQLYNATILISCFDEICTDGVDNRKTWLELYYKQSKTIRSN